MREPRELGPRRGVVRLLASHPEAQSLMAEAGHCHALAEYSATEETRTFKVMQECQLRYVELRHRLDPRGRRTIHFGVTLALTAAIVAALLVLNDIEFAGVLAGPVTAAAAATAAWTGCAWLAAITAREGHGGRLAAVIGGTVSSGLLLAILHGDGRGPDLRYRLGAGVLAALLILGLVAVAAALIVRTEPASLLLVRYQWHRSQSAYEAAVAIRRSDAEAAAATGQGWRGLIQPQADPPTDGGE